MFTNNADFRKMKNINIPIFAIDFEGSRKIGVVEYGIARIDSDEIVTVDTSLCSPKIPIPQRDADFFGIDNAEANKFPSFSECVKKFKKMRQIGIFLAHNSIVEDNLLRDVMPSPAIVPNFVKGGETSKWGDWLDSCVLLKNLYPSLESAKLSTSIEAFGLKNKLDNLAEKFCPQNRRKWHCAAYDAIASALLLIEICSQDGFENVTIDWLANFSKSAPERESELF